MAESRVIDQGASGAEAVLGASDWLTSGSWRPTVDAEGRGSGWTAKRQVVADLGARRLSLAEAVARFRAIDARLPAQVRAVLDRLAAELSEYLSGPAE